MKKASAEPTCANVPLPPSLVRAGTIGRPSEHSWQDLGVEDNGDKVNRCGNCLVLRYEDSRGQFRYEIPEST